MTPSRQVRCRPLGSADLAFESRDRRTPIYGVVGRPVMHSLSPAMHNAAFVSMGVDGVYLPLAAADFEDFLRLPMRSMLQGASITAPFKLAAFDCADAESMTISRRMGAVNTLTRRRGLGRLRTPMSLAFSSRWTDAMVRGVRVTVLGAGGAARASPTRCARPVLACRWLRAPARAADVARAAGAGGGRLATAAGLVGRAGQRHTGGHRGPTRPNAAPARSVYRLARVRPRLQPASRPACCADARAAGCETLGGLDMLVAQAARQFEWWTGVATPTDVMRAAAMRALAGRTSGAEAPRHRKHLRNLYEADNVR